MDFFSSKSVQESKIEFSKSRQNPNEPLHQYISRLKQTLATINPNTSVEDQIFMISSKLPQRVQNRLNQLKFDSYEDFVIKAKAIEDEFKFEDRRRKVIGNDAGPSGSAPNQNPTGYRFNNKGNHFQKNPNSGETRPRNFQQNNLNQKFQQLSITPAGPSSNQPNPKPNHFRKSNMQNSKNFKSSPNLSISQCEIKICVDKPDKNVVIVKENNSSKKRVPKEPKKAKQNSATISNVNQNFGMDSVHNVSSNKLTSRLQVTIGQMIVEAILEQSVQTSTISTKLAQQIGIYLAETNQTYLDTFDVRIPLSTDKSNLFRMKVRILEKSGDDLVLGQDFIAFYSKI